MDDLAFELHFAADIAESDHIDELMRALGAVAPGFADDLGVLAQETDRAPLGRNWREPGVLRAAVLEKGGRRGSTYRQLQADSPPARHARRFGQAAIRGATPSTYLRIQFDEYVPARPSGDKWLFSNSIAGRVGRPRVAGRTREAFVRELTHRLATLPSLLWGSACLSSEFRSRNLHDGPDGVWALGRDVSRHLPGLYWLNFFGPPYVALMGREVLVSASPVTADELDSGAIALQLYDRPEDWRAKAGQTRRFEVLRKIGERYFYDRENPERPSEAPALGLSKLDEARTYQVFTADGEAFTSLPELRHEVQPE